MAPLADALKLLGLHHTAAHLDDLVALATKRRWSPDPAPRAPRRGRAAGTRPPQPRTPPAPQPPRPHHAHGRLRLGLAHADRPRRRRGRAPPRLPHRRPQLVLVAAQGLGKTMIAQNIAHQAVLAGHHVLFTTAAQLLLDLGSQESARGLARRLNALRPAGPPGPRRARLPRPTTPAPPTSSSRSSAAATNGRVSSSRRTWRFRDWPTIFPNAGSAIALIDRLIHHAEIITIEGESYRAAGRGHPQAPRPPPRADRRRSKFPRFLMSRNNPAADPPRLQLAGPDPPPYRLLGHTQFEGGGGVVSCPLPPAGRSVRHAAPPARACERSSAPGAAGARPVPAFASTRG